MICTLGNFATKLLRDDPTGITRIHGRPEVRLVGSRPVRIFPIFHPAAALYTRSMLDTLREDFSRLPGLLALEPPTVDAPELPADPRPLPAQTPPTPPAEPAPEHPVNVATPGKPAQLGLFE